ncbi:MAG: hypothetical protein AB7S38_28910 [Vulcanimicrobiota bacterium]
MIAGQVECITPDGKDLLRLVVLDVPFCHAIRVVDDTVARAVRIGDQVEWDERRLWVGGRLLKHRGAPWEFKLEERD